MNTRRIKDKLVKLYTKLYSLFHPIEKKILFDSFGGKQYSDNPRAICEKMHELYPQFELVWVLYDKEDKYGIIPDYVRVVQRTITNYYKELATSFCYVTNENINFNIAKRSNQFFIQTWHGDRGFKKIIYEANVNSPVKIADNKVTDVAISGSSFCEGVYRSAFHYYGEILKTGSPRNDRLLQGISEQEIQTIKSNLCIESGTKLLLYAPTFRDHSSGNKQDINVDLTAVLNILSMKGGEWKCLLRAHSASGGLNYIEDTRILDVTLYPDMADLLAISDFLITDYSSSCCDYVLTGRPVVLTIYDIEEYVAQSRTFKVTPEESGFMIADSNEELMHIIKQTTIEQFKICDEKVLEFYGAYESGNASEKVSHRINQEYIKRVGNK